MNARRLLIDEQALTAGFPAMFTYVERIKQ